MGYHLGPEGLAIAQKILYNFVERAIRLYEQGPPALKARRLGEYVKQWVRWAGAGLGKIDREGGFLMSILVNAILAPWDQSAPPIAAYTSWV